MTYQEIFPRHQPKTIEALSSGPWHRPKMTEALSSGPRHQPKTIEVLSSGPWYHTPDLSYAAIHGAQQGRGRRPMSLVVALQNHEAVVVAVDSREVIGGGKGGARRTIDLAQKYKRLNENYVLAISKSWTGFTRHLFRMVDRRWDTSLRNIADIVNSMSQLLRDSLNLTLKGIPDDWRNALGYDFSVCIAGLDENQCPAIYKLCSSTLFVPDDVHGEGFLALGVPRVAYHWLLKMYSKHASIDQMRRLALWCQWETGFSDEDVGGPIHIITITKDNGFEVDTVAVDDRRRKELKQVSGTVVDTVEQWVGR